MKKYNEILTSRSNSLVKLFASLSDKKGRDQNKMFMAEGVKLTLEAAEAKLPIAYVILCEEKYSELYDKLSDAFSDDIYKDTVLITVSASVFEKITTEKAPQGVISIIKYLDFFSVMDIIYKEEFFLLPEEKAIILCSVRDPSNLGAVIRSSVAFGVDHIVLTGNCADVYNPKTVRSAMGSLYRVNITSFNDTQALIKQCQKNGRRVLAAELSDKAKSLEDIELIRTDLVMIGNEGHGIPSEISDICDSGVYIPISKKTESLNASVAAAIFMWEQSKR